MEVALEAEDGPYARVLIQALRVSPARRQRYAQNARAGLAATPGATIKSDKRIVYQGHTGSELRTDEATVLPITLHVATFELPQEQAILSCEGPTVPEVELTCESFLRSVRVHGEP
jgi:hypothetical protein